MRDSLLIVFRVLVAVFVFSSVLSAGLRLAVREVFAPLRRPRLLALSLAANFLVAPAIAWGIVLALSAVRPLDPSHAAGLLLLGLGAGAPFLPKLVAFGRGDLASSVALMALLMTLTVGWLPLTVPVLLPGFPVGVWSLVRPLVVLMLVPLLLGLLFRWRAPGVTGRVQPWVERVSNVTLAGALSLFIGLNLRALAGTLGSGAIAAAILFVALATAAGYALGGPGRATREVLALGTGQRNIAAGLVIAASPGVEAGVGVMLLVTTLAGLVPLLGAGAWFRRRNAAAQSPPAPGGGKIGGQ